MQHSALPNRASLTPATGLLPVFLLYAGPASAHGNLNIGGFYQGMATIVLHWEQLVFLIVAGLWCAQQSAETRTATGAALITGLIAGLTTGLLGGLKVNPMLLASASYSLVGILVAANWPKSNYFTLPMAVLAGLSNGTALGSNEAGTLEYPIFFGLGLAAGTSLALFYIVSAISRLPRGWPWVGVRIAGSWAAAIGLMAGAFALALPR